MEILSYTTTYTLKDLSTFSCHMVESVFNNFLILEINKNIEQSSIIKNYISNMHNMK